MNKLITLLFLIVIFFFLSTNVSIGIPIRGFVVDASSGEPLPVAAVLVDGTDWGSSTNLDGYFVIDIPEAGIFTLNVSYIGYRSLQQEITVYLDTNEILTIEIEPASVVLDEAVVVVKQDDHEKQRRSPQVSTVPVDAKIIRVMPSLGAEMDVLRALQTIPGVKASSDLNSAIHVRGGSPDQTLILLDHTTVYNPSHLFGLFSTFNADAVKRIELIKGGFPAYYGGRSGSVLEVITDEGNRKETKGLVSIGIISARVSLEGPLPKERGSYAVSFRRTYMDPILKVMRESYDVDLPNYYFYDSNAKGNLDNTNLNIILSKNSTLTLAGYWGNDRMLFDFGDSDSRLRAYMSWGNRTFTSRYRQAVGENMFWSVSGTVSRYRSKWSFKNDEYVFEDAYDKFMDYAIKSDLEFLGSRDHHVKVGVMASRWDFRFRNGNSDIQTVDVDTTAYTYALYAQDNWRLGSLFELQPGVRAYYHDSGAHYQLDPRLALVYRHDVDMRFKLALGRYSQFVNVISFGDAFNNFDVWIPVDGSMRPSYSHQAVIGWEWDRSDGYEVTTEAYYTDMNNITTYDPLTDRSTGAASDAFVVGDGYAYGFEWMIRRNMGRLTGWIGYSLSWTKRHFPGSSVNSGNWFYPKWDRRHDFVAVASLKLSKNWDISGSWRYNTGQGFTQAVGMYTMNIGEGLNEYVGDRGITYLPGEKNNYRFPEDHRLDLTFNYSHLFMGKKNLPAKLIISIFNAYSRRPYWQRNFSGEFNENGDYITEVTDIKMLPILPLIGYEVRF